MCLLGQCGSGKEGLSHSLSLSSSTRDALLCDIAKVIQESWSEVLEGWFQCWYHAKLWSYFQGVRFYQPSLLFWGKATGPIPSLETVTNIIMNIPPGKESMSTKQSWLRILTSICSQGKLHYFYQEPYWHLHLVDVKMALRWQEGHGQKIKKF